MRRSHQFSDIIIRKLNDFSIADINEKGIIQTILFAYKLSGHSLLTVLLGEDDCI